MAQIEDLIAAYTLGSVAGLDTGTGKRDVDLKDPLVYTDTEIEDVPLPDDLKYVTRGEGLRKKEYVGNKGRDELNFLQKVGLGIVDAMSDNKFDWDKADLIPKDEYNEKRLLEKKLKGDLRGDALPSPEQTRKNLVNQAIRDDLLEYNNMMPSFTRQNENDTNSSAYKKKMKTVHGEVRTVNKTGIAKLNKVLKKKGKIESDDFGEVNYKKVDMTNHKPIVKKKW